MLPNTYFGLIFMTLEPLKAATYKFPSVSMVIPSARKPGLRSLFTKSIRTRSLAANHIEFSQSLFQISK